MPTDKEIFDQAVSAEPIAAVEQTTNEPETPTEAHTEAKEGRVRDEKGRFVSATTDEPEKVAEPEAVAPKVEEAKPVEEKDHAIPSWRLKEEADARREWQQRAEAAEREREHFRQQMWQLQQQQQKLQSPQEPVDIFADPQKWEQTFEQRLMAKQRELEGNFSLRMAALKHGQETFDEAYRALADAVGRGDTATHQQIINSPDPGETLVNWHKREKTMALVGPDPEAFVKKALEEALNNPEFLAQAVEKAKGVASTQPTQAIKVPPSLSKASAAKSAHEGSIKTQEDIWKFAIGR